MKKEAEVCPFYKTKTFIHIISLSLSLSLSDTFQYTISIVGRYKGTLTVYFSNACTYTHTLSSFSTCHMCHSQGEPVTESFQISFQLP